MNLRATTAFCLLLLVQTLSAAAQAAPTPVTQAADKPPIEYPSGTPGRVAVLKKIRSRTDNTKIGELQRGWLCSSGGDLLWTTALHNAVTTNFGRIYREEMEKLHYPTPTQSDSMFDEAKDKPAAPDLEVGVFLKQINGNFCYDGSSVGGAYLKTFWQVYAPEGQKVVFETTTEGSYQSDKPEKSNIIFFEKAFRAALRNLLAEQGFYNVITNTTPLAAPKAAGGDKLKMSGGKPSNELLTKNVTTLRSAVVTIFSDPASGSGFFISKDGYLLTNKHVVGTAKFIKVKLPTGRELVGEVLRSDATRDVVLIKTEPIDVPALPARQDDPTIGEEVYALGSPLGDKFNTSLTRGILSGYRTIDDKRYLQSDVAILPGNSGGPLLDANGNVIGITVMGLGAKGLAGMNFFIPINEAIDKLGLDIGN
jgi:serine protease Do